MRVMVNSHGVGGDDDDDDHDVDVCWPHLFCHCIPKADSASKGRRRKTVPLAALHGGLIGQAAVVSSRQFLKN